MSTYGLEGSDPGARLVSSDVVDGGTGLDAKSEVGYLRHALVGAVPGLEVNIGRPVVGEILRVCATRAGGGRRRVVAIGRHARVEGVASDDLVHVRGRCVARLNEGVDTVDRELRASEAHQLLCGSKLHGHSWDESLQQHGELGSFGGVQ